MSHVQISFILPMYNVERFLDKCVRSLLQQNLPRGTFEIILVNDGSKDNTLAIAQRLASEWPEIKVIDQKNSGQSVARNRGAKVAKGEYIWFVDSDDFLLAGVADYLFKLATNNCLDLLTFGVNHVKQGQVCPFLFSTDKKLESILGGEEYIAKYNYNNSPCLYLIKRSFLEQTGVSFIEGVYCEDGLFSLTLISVASRVAYYPSSPYVYVKNATSTTKKKSHAHYMKVANDFCFAIGFFEKFIKSKSEQGFSSAFLKRVKSRKDSYTMFLCFRLLQSEMTTVEILNWYHRMRSNNWIPMIDLSYEEYPGIRYKFSKIFINKTYLFKALVNVAHFLKMIRKNVFK